MVVRTIADIAEGAEILVTYIPLYHTRAERRSLLAIFNFHRNCLACIGPYNPASDRRRVRIGALPDLLEEAGFREDIVGGLRIAKERIRVRDREGLNDLHDQAYDYHDAFEAAVMCSDVDTAKRYIRLAYAYRFLCYGAEHVRTGTWWSLYDNPMSHPSAGSALQPMKLPAICDACTKEEAGGFQGTKGKGGECGECSFAVYCSKKCKVAHAARHKAVCDVLRMRK